MTLKDSIEISQLKIRSYAPELFWAILTFAITSYLLQLLNIQQYEWFDSFLPISLIILKPLLWILLFLLTFPLFEYVLKFFKRGVDYKFSVQDWPNRWMYHGGIVSTTSPDGLIVKHSASGCLLKERLWKDFEIRFEMKYDSSLLHKSLEFRSIGILFRAENLESYYMFEIATNEKSGDLFVKPHVRLLGHWEPVDFTKVDNINLNDLLKVKLSANGRKVKFYLNGLLKYEWILPDRIDFYGNDKSEKLESKDKKDKSRTVLETPFLNAYGMVGFRADWGQGATVSNIRIKSLSQIDKTLVSLLRIRKGS